MSSNFFGGGNASDGKEGWDRGCRKFCDRLLVGSQALRKFFHYSGFVFSCSKVEFPLCPGSDEDACEATSLQGLVQKTADIYEWPIDEQGNMSKGSFLHPEVSCKPEVCQRCFLICNFQVTLECGDYSNLQDWNMAIQGIQVLQTITN